MLFSRRPGQPAHVLFGCILQEFRERESRRGTVREKVHCRP